MPTLLVEVHKNWRTQASDIEKIYELLGTQDKKLLWIEDEDEWLRGTTALDEILKSSQTGSASTEWKGNIKISLDIHHQGSALHMKNLWHHKHNSGENEISIKFEPVWNNIDRL